MSNENENLADEVFRGMVKSVDGKPLALKIPTGDGRLFNALLVALTFIRHSPKGSGKTTVLTKMKEVLR